MDEGCGERSPCIYDEKWWTRLMFGYHARPHPIADGRSNIVGALVLYRTRIRRVLHPIAGGGC